MTPKTHSLAIILACLSVGLGYLVAVGVLGYNAVVHDSADTTTVMWFGLGSLLVLAILLVGAPVVLAILRGLGLPVPVDTTPTPTPPPSS